MHTMHTMVNVKYILKQENVYTEPYKLTVLFVPLKTKSPSLIDLLGLKQLVATSNQLLVQDLWN